MRYARPAAVVSAALLLGAAFAAPASADPVKSGITVDISCPDLGFAVEAVVNGSGWAPAHVTSTTDILIPVGFANESYTVTVGGAVVDEGFNPGPYFKGSHSAENSTLCSYSGEFEEDGAVITVSGDVYVKTKK